MFTLLLCLKKGGFMYIYQKTEKGSREVICKVTEGWDFIISFQGSSGREVGAVPLVEGKKNQVSPTMSAHQMSHPLELMCLRGRKIKELVVSSRMKSGKTDYSSPLTTPGRSQVSVAFNFLSCVKQRTQLWKTSARESRRGGARGAHGIYNIVRGIILAKKKSSLIFFLQNWRREQSDVV